MLSRDSFAQAAGTEPPTVIPERNRIFLDEEAAKEFGAAGTPVRFVGFVTLKGFSGLHRVYEVLWTASDPRPAHPDASA